MRAAADQKSTVDYIGAVQGIPVCFDAKECAADTFSLQNIHRHQVTVLFWSKYASVMWRVSLSIVIGVIGVGFSDLLHVKR